MIRLAATSIAAAIVMLGVPAQAGTAGDLRQLVEICDQWFEAPENAEQRAVAELAERPAWPEQARSFRRGEDGGVELIRPLDNGRPRSCVLSLQTESLVEGRRQFQHLMAELERRGFSVRDMSNTRLVSELDRETESSLLPQLTARKATEGDAVAVYLRVDEVNETGRVFILQFSQPDIEEVMGAASAAGETSGEHRQTPQAQ